MGIKIKVGFCIECTDKVEKPLTAKRCQFHYWNYRASLKPIKIKEIGKSDWKEAKRKEMNAFLGEAKIEKKKQKPIPKVSQKQVERLAQYRKVRDHFMKEHPNCQARLQGCTIKSTDCHHSRGKVGDLLTDNRYFKALCRSCHSYIETHPFNAKEMGFSLSRLKTTE